MISPAIIYALLSLFFAGIIDVVFKRYSRHNHSRGMLIFGIGIVWTVLQVVDINVSQNAIALTWTTWVYGSIAGICVAGANITLLEAFRHMDVSLGSTIYRLNTIGVVILSAAFLDESMSIFKMIGISFGVVAVLLLYQRTEREGDQAMLRIGLPIIIVASLLRALYGVISKAGLSAGADADGLMLISSFCWIVSGLGYALFFERRYAITRRKIMYAGFCGCLVYAIVNCLIAALDRGEASIVLPIANMSFVIAFLIAFVFKMEKINPKKIVAMLFAVSAIALLTRA